LEQRRLLEEQSQQFEAVQAPMVVADAMPKPSGMLFAE
jgi:hypothetical protein